jgi:hypothetical protein
MIKGKNEDNKKEALKASLIWLRGYEPNELPTAPPRDVST